MRKFKLMGFKRGRDLRAIILVSSTGKTFNAPLQDIVESEIIEGLSHMENKEIYRKLYSSSDSKSHYEFEERSEKNWFSYLYLSVLLSVFYLISNIIGIKPASVFGLTVPAAIFVYPLTYIVSDILNEFYGLRFARKAINIAFINNLTFCFLLFLSTKVTAIDNWILQYSFNGIIHEMIGVLIASSVSYIVSEHTNAYLLHKLKILTKAKLLPLRVFTSTLISSFIDSFIFINIAFHYLDQHVIWSMIGGQIVIKIIYAVFGVIPVYMFRCFFRKYIYKQVG